MKIENLMIGDWVCYDDGSIPNFIPQQIAEIHCLGEVQFLNGLDMAKEYIHPISITEEILNNNNVPYEFYDCYHFDFGNAFGQRGRACSVYGIWHVHELQQAMRLAGFVDWANNFKI